MVPLKDLREFASEKLQVLYTVARSISQHYGGVSASIIDSIVHYGPKELEVQWVLQLKTWLPN